MNAFATDCSPALVETDKTGETGEVPVVSNDEFLRTLFAGRSLQRLARFDVPTGQRPQAMAGLDAAPAQQHLPLPFGEADCDQSRVAVVRGLTTSAAISQRCAMRVHLHIQTERTAVAAEFRTRRMCLASARGARD